ncbi:protein draper-like, partial [Temnothorax curvispinosus]|uniref:Protein draper-like n=1 Tax=Temnothorax curvispinosus TaxID=300111 RepID=A0A6J1Q1B6_9HYME
VCQCRPGWQGEYCQTPCTEGTYGVNCTQHCKCQNNGKCRLKDGHCQCPPGWTGTMCTEICPEGYYGHHCLEICECKNEFFRCHSVEGCICRQGYTGENCDEQLFSRNIQEKDIKDILAGVFAIIVIIGALLTAWMYRRRRMAVKNEMAQVRYTAKSEKGKFDISSCTDEDDSEGTFGQQYYLQKKDDHVKNLNLNVYHNEISGMNDKRVEHIYDKIKQSPLRAG